MSFFDDDEPTRATRPARPRRPAPAAARPRRSAAAPDPQTLRNRQIAALGAGIVVFFLLVLGVKGCLDSRKERALKDYNREVTAIVSSSNEQVSEPFFELLGGATGDATELEQGINEYRVVADQDAQRARSLDAPDEMAPAQQNLELVMNLRAEALRKIADRIGAAKADGEDNRQSAENAVRQIAGQMSAFLASDVVYSQRVAPLIKQALDEAEISGQSIATSQFLPTVAWLNVDQVAGRLGAQRAGGGQGASSAPAPGTHGHGLESTAVGTTTLQPGGSVNRVQAGSNLAFTVKFANQGENDETDVRVFVRVRSPGTKTISVSKTINQTKAGTSITTVVPLTDAPPIGTPSTVEVEVRGVPGEKVLDNNKSTYTVLFTR
ncbi:hypothetical protein GKE82_14845 [Conexibacter sp. W3-3-2]|uniref:hypothetical protein n=1 Tax=Conexibacter sp. W3-3-2 TaxID=2675227 RepID=UPI0012B851C2|nr:hypothetical protein [Conexibacter sp. W3-3-2]MTD45531.1 hypothetical protein [Conexibacter sp. W3-3-2]